MPTLRHDNTGAIVKMGDVVTSFRGEKHIVVGWPTNGRNRVYVQLANDDGTPILTGKVDTREYFPQVFDLRWHRDEDGE